MRDEQYQGLDLAQPELRRLFTREALLASDWYHARLLAKQRLERTRWRRNVDYLDRFLKKASHADEAARLGISGRLVQARHTLEAVESPSYLGQLQGTLGVEPIDTW